MTSPNFLPAAQRVPSRGTQAPSSAPGRRIRVGRPGRAGFNLIEVTVALGVVSFAFLSMLGLLPLGMTAFHSAIEISVGSQISQNIMNDLQETDFNTLTASSSVLRYFDDQGIELTSATGAVYQVNVQVLPMPVLPGAAAANRNLASVVIQIARNPANLPLSTNSENLWNDTPGVSLTTYSTVIAGNSAGNGALGTN